MSLYHALKAASLEKLFNDLEVGTLEIQQNAFIIRVTMYWNKQPDALKAKTF